MIADREGALRLTADCEPAAFEPDNDDFHQHPPPPPTSSRQGAPECLLRPQTKQPRAHHCNIDLAQWGWAVLVWRLWWRLHREVALFFMVHDSLRSNGCCFGLLAVFHTTWLVGCPLVGRLFVYWSVVCWSVVRWSVVRWSVVRWSVVRWSVIACWSFASLLYHNDTRHFPHPIYYSAHNIYLYIHW
jgi:hypothetical protein